MADKFTGEDRDQLYELLQKLSGAVAELQEPARPRMPPIQRSSSRSS